MKETGNFIWKNKRKSDISSAVFLSCMKLTVATQVHATEDGDKIKSALETVFPKIKFKKTKSQISGESDSAENLDYIKEKVIAKQIKSTVRYILLQYKTETGTKFMLNKQTFMLGKINFVEENYPLGNIIVDIETDNLEGLVDYMTGILN